MPPPELKAKRRSMAPHLCRPNGSGVSRGGLGGEGAVLRLECFGNVTVGFCMFKFLGVAKTHGELSG